MQQHHPPTREGVYFTVTTMAVSDNRKLGRAIKDQDGFYTNVPVAVLGTVTRNRTSYDTEAFMGQLKGPDTSIYRRITEGTLFSEWGHPFVDLNSELGMARLLNLDPQKESNRIRSISVQHVDDLNLDLVTMDACPSGPYGKYFEELMENPNTNIAFSLRGLSQAFFDKASKVTHKRLINLVTFDSGVASGGFLEASKRYMAAKEDLAFESCEIIDRQMSMDDILTVRNVAMESFTNTELNELLKANKVVIGKVDIGYVDANSKTVVNPETGERNSLFNSFMRVKR